MADEESTQSNTRDSGRSEPAQAKQRQRRRYCFLTVTAVVTHHPMELAPRRVDRPVFVQDCDELELVLLASLEIVRVAAIGGQPPGGRTGSA